MEDLTFRRKFEKAFLVTANFANLGQVVATITEKDLFKEGTFKYWCSPDQRLWNKSP